MSLAVISSALDLDPQRLQEMEDRLAAVHAAARKYRVTPR